MNQKFNISIKSFVLCFLFALLLQTMAVGQEYPFTPFSLTDLSNFKNPSTNWQIVGDVYADRNQQNMMKATAGAGTLVNLPSDKAKDDLFGAWEHGDIEIELEFMMPKGSNSGIYLQSRYELQLLDSWGKKNPKAGDCAGIYERWDESKPDGQKGYQGHPPRMNASKAPGLWQTLRIEFQAPRFDASGKKIANAKFIKVVHNGMLVHDNVELSGVTRGAVSEQEVAFAPLRIQGDHGAVAFRNIRYKRFDKQPLRLENITYQCYKGIFNGIPKFDTVKVVKQGKAEFVSSELACEDNNFALRFVGEVSIPETGDYYFTIHQGGSSHLLIDGKIAVKENKFESWFGEPRTEIVSLSAGKHSFEVAYKKNTNWIPVALGLSVEGNGIHRQDLHSLGSIPFVASEGAIYTNPKQKPEILRTFMDFKDEKLTHVISIGEISKINYSYNMKQGALFQVWRGDFLDVTGMWQDRGGSQVATALGNPMQLFSAPILLTLADANASWTSKYSENDGFKIKGYDIDENGRPIFKYFYNDMQIDDRILPEDDNKILSREISISSAASHTNLYAKIGEGKDISQLPDGSYSIDGKQYYLQIVDIGKSKAIIRQSGDKKELLVNVVFDANKAKIKYAVIW
ncbi:MAG: DUF1080 domain-containing protein [Cytophagales bacterium]|nr:MAG: DUF1080 domain-containing protein [Cytophagales bacterium]